MRIALLSSLDRIERMHEHISCGASKPAGYHGLLRQVSLDEATGETLGKHAHGE